MYARAEGRRVKVGIWNNDPAEYLWPLTELEEAQAAYTARLAAFSSAELRPYEDRLLAAEQDVEDAFSEVYTIEQAERLAASLFAAITEARANDGRFGGDE